MTKAEAEQVEKESGGFLVAVPYGEGGELMELRPSVPETVTIDGKEVSFRRNYNYIVKAVFASMFDKKTGQIKPDAVAVATQTQKALIFDMGTDRISEGLEAIRPTLVDILRDAHKDDADPEGAATTEAEKICSDWKLLISQYAEYQGPVDTIEIDDMVSRVSDVFSLNTQKMMESGMSVSGATKEEVQKAIEEVQRDALRSVQEMSDIAMMDPESKVAAIPNTCVANGMFIQKIKKYLMHKDEPYLEYQYTTSGDTHVTREPKKVLEKLLADFDLLTSATPMKEATKQQLPAQKQKLLGYLDKVNGNQDLTPEELNDLDKFASMFARYTAHVSSPAYSKQEGGETVTYVTETFATVSSQLVTSPFTLNGAVGTYKGDAAEGMKKFYDKDNPFERTRLDQIKRKIISDFHGIRY